MIHLRKITKIITAVAISWFISQDSLQACTGLKLICKDGTAVHGRTLEFGVQVESSVAVIPRNYEFIGTTPQGPGLKYKAKYAAVGVIAFGNPAIMDGMNEKGLSIGTFYFPGFAGYSKVTSENQSTALSPVEFSNWILTQFETLEEVKINLPSVIIAETVTEGWGNTPAPFHYIVYDKAGQALVIEPISGTLVTYENPLGVFTNSPAFDWHMTNLRNFINLKSVNANPIKLNDVSLSPFGQGSGMVGMPGDFTPPSRFVRASIFSATAIPSDDSEKGVFQVFHLLNQFDIPVGVARQVENGVIHSDMTLATCVKDPSTLKYYFKTYENQSIKFVDLKKFDLSAKSIKQISTDGKQTALDISSSLQEKR